MAPLMMYGKTWLESAGANGPKRQVKQLFDWSVRAQQRGMGVVI